MLLINNFNQVTFAGYVKNSLIIDDDDEKLRDHCHITGKFKGQLTGVVTKIFN